MPTRELFCKWSKGVDPPHVTTFLFRSMTVVTHSADFFLWQRGELLAPELVEESCESDNSRLEDWLTRERDVTGTVKSFVVSGSSVSSSVAGSSFSDALTIDPEHPFLSTYVQLEQGSTYDKNNTDLGANEQGLLFSGLDSWNMSGFVVEDSSVVATGWLNSHVFTMANSSENWCESDTSVVQPLDPKDADVDFFDTQKLIMERGVSLWKCETYEHLGLINKAEAEEALRKANRRTAVVGASLGSALGILLLVVAAHYCVRTTKGRGADQ